LPLTSTPSARDAQSRETLLILLGTRHAREPPHCTRPVTRHAFLFQTTANPKTQPDHELTRLRAAQPPPKGQPSQTHASSPCLHHLHLLTCCPCGGRRLASLHSGPVSVTAGAPDVKCFCSGDYPHLCPASGERVVGGIGEGGGGDKDGADAGEEEIGAVAVDPQAELARPPCGRRRTAQPADGSARARPSRGGRRTWRPAGPAGRGDACAPACARACPPRPGRPPGRSGRCARSGDDGASPCRPSGHRERSGWGHWSAGPDRDPGRGRGQRAATAASLDPAAGW